MSVLRQQHPNITTAIMTQYDLPTLQEAPPPSPHIFEQTDIAPVRVQGRPWSGSK
jgi:hypothetical protein